MPRHAFQKPQNEIDRKIVLTKAVGRVMTNLNLSQKELSGILRRSESTFSRLFNTTSKIHKPNYISPDSNEGQLAILLIRLFQNLDELFGGDNRLCQVWLRTYNNHLQQTPIEMIQSIEGFVVVVHYLDAIKNRI